MEQVQTFPRVLTAWKRVTRLESERARWAWVLLAPTLFVLLLVAGWPLFRTLLISFTDANLLSLDEGYQFVGLKNYFRILGDRSWWIAVKNTLLFASLSVLCETVLGLLVALVLNTPFRGRSLLRAAVMVPWAIPTVVSAKMWSWMLNDLYGVINDLLLRCHLISKRIPWLADDFYTFISLIAVDVWKTTPFMALLLLAGLQTISKDVIEAAKLDSPSRVHTFFHVTLPLLRRPLIVAVTFRMLDALRVFDLFYILAGNKSSTASVATFARQQIVEFQMFGYGSAASILIFLMIGLLILFYLQLLQTRTDTAK